MVNPSKYWQLDSSQHVMHARAKLMKIVGGVHSPNLPTSRLPSSPICRRRLTLCFISNATLTSTNDIQQMCQKANLWVGAMPSYTLCGYTPGCMTFYTKIGLNTFINFHTSPVNCLKCVSNLLKMLLVFLMTERFDFV